VTLLLKRGFGSVAHPATVVTFFSTLVDNRRIMPVIEPLAQSDRANLQLQLFRLTGTQSRVSLFCLPRHFVGRKEAS
jgi:hypothetical protein